MVEEETTELKQPVCKRGSILLGVNINQNSIRIYRTTRNKKINRITYNIFGQSNAIGILTLHWKIENHKRITLNILDKMKRIQKKMESK